MQHPTQKKASLTILRQYLDSHHIISIIGTVKNAGKTTVLNAIIEEYKEVPIAITSIGLDGEKTDTITKLPKPQIHVYPHTIIATAYDCIESDVVIHENTGIMTPLGEIVIIEVLSDMDVLVAGPSTKHELIDVVNRLKKYNVAKILIDGALFRKSLAATTVTDAVILSTGAAYHRDIDVVVEDTVDIVQQFQLEEIDESIQNKLPDYNAVIELDGTIHEIQSNWIHSKPQVLQRYINNKVRYLYIKGALTDAIIQGLFDCRTRIYTLEIIIHDATYIVCSMKQYRLLQKMKIGLRVIDQSHLLFVTYNPTSPYRYQFDNIEMKQRLEEHIEIPCINVVEDRK